MPEARMASSSRRSSPKSAVACMHVIPEAGLWQYTRVGKPCSSPLTDLCPALTNQCWLYVNTIEKPPVTEESHRLDTDHAGGLSHRVALSGGGPDFVAPNWNGLGRNRHQVWNPALRV